MMMMECSQINQAQFEALMAIEQTVQLIPWQAKQFIDYQTQIDSNLADLQRVHNLGFIYLSEENCVFGYWFGQKVIDELHLHNISVAKAVQNQGLGRLLLSHFLETAQKLTCQSAWLEVRESNQVAIKLYQQHGFVLAGKRKHYYALPGQDQRESALIFKKIL